MIQFYFEIIRLYIYIHTYIYMCVCVRVCVCLCMRVYVYIQIFSSYLFVVNPSAKYSSEDNLAENIKPLVAE